MLVLSLLTPTLLLSLLFNDRRYCRRRRRREMISSIDIFEVLNSSNIVRKCSSSSSSFSPPLISLRAPFCFNRLCTNRTSFVLHYSATTVADPRSARVLSLFHARLYVYIDRYTLCCRERFSTRFTPRRTTCFFSLFCAETGEGDQTTVRFSLFTLLLVFLLFRSRRNASFFFSLSLSLSLSLSHSTHFLSSSH